MDKRIFFINSKLDQELNFIKLTVYFHLDSPNSWVQSGKVLTKSLLILIGRSTVAADSYTS